eukprot:PhM_4_TR9517/c1_g3_i1/m.98326
MSLFNNKSASYEETLPIASAAKPPKVQPVPLHELSAMARDKKNGNKKKNADEDVPKALRGMAPDRAGQCTVTLSPTCLDKCFMLPFPFLGIGCCMSRTTVLTFDDDAECVVMKSNPGYLFCLRKTTEIAYKDVGNIAAQHVSGVQINDQPAYRVVLLDRSANVHRLTGDMMMVEANKYAAALHKYMFGRANPETYSAPSIMTMF